MALALGMGVGTIGAIALQGPLVTRYVVVDLRPAEPPGTTAPDPQSEPSQPLDPGGPGPPGEPGVPPPGTTGARVSTGRGTASVREAWLRERGRTKQAETGPAGTERAPGTGRRPRPKGEAELGTVPATTAPSTTAPSTTAVPVTRPSTTPTSSPAFEPSPNRTSKR